MKLSYGFLSFCAALVCLGACEQKDPAQKLFEQGSAAFDPDDRADAIRYYEQACELNHAEACAELGYAYYSKDELPTQDLTKSLAAFERACGLGSGDGCTGAAGWWELESETEPKYALIIPFLERGCELDAKISCYDLGSRYMDGEGVESDPVKGRGLLEKSCMLGDETGCYDYAILLREAVGGWVNFEKARELFYAGCHEHDLPHACNDYGEMLLTGDGGDADVDGGLEYFTKACEAELNYACTNVAVVHAGEAYGRVVPELEAEFSIRGCELGDAKGCLIASEVYQFGVGRDPDREAMKSYRKKACIAGGEYDFCPKD